MRGEWKRGVANTWTIGKYVPLYLTKSPSSSLEPLNHNAADGGPGNLLSTRRIARPRRRLWNVDLFVSGFRYYRKEAALASEAFTSPSPS